MKGRFIKMMVGIFPQLVLISLDQTNMGFENSLREIFPAKKSDLLDLLDKDNIMSLENVGYKHGTTILIAHEVAVIMRINFVPSNAAGQGLLAHEIFHIADAVIQNSGVEYSRSNETLAHAVGYITEKVYKEIGN